VNVDSLKKDGDEYFRSAIFEIWQVSRLYEAVFYADQSKSSSNIGFLGKSDRQICAILETHTLRPAQLR
jgi:hypothetical protein